MERKKEELLKMEKIVENNLCNIDDLFELGLCYLNGDGVEYNEEKGLTLLQEAADQGNAKALSAMGYYYIGEDLGIAEERSKEDIKKGITCYQQAAEKGDPHAQERLGMCYHYGFLLQKKDDEEAAKMFREAAEQDYEYSQYMLGSMYYEGCGVEKDLAKAEYWFNKAADNDWSNAKTIIEHLNEYKKNINESAEHIKELEEIIKDDLYLG